MTIIGFNFTELSVKRESAAKGKVSVTNKVNLTNVVTQETSVGGEGSKVNKIDFDFEISYNPEVGSMKLSGSLAYLAKTEDSENIVKEWTDKKTLPEGVNRVVMKQILEKCMIQAIIMSKDVLLPSPVPLPKLSSTKKSE